MSNATTFSSRRNLHCFEGCQVLSALACMTDPIAALTTPLDAEDQVTRQKAWQKELERIEDEEGAQGVNHLLMNCNFWCATKMLLTSRGYASPVTLSNFSPFLSIPVLMHFHVGMKHGSLSTPS